MISNYLYTIGKYLSPSQRDEVLKEVETNLYDYLEENFGEKEYTDFEIEEAIKSMGHPKKVAEAYMNSPRCLIGPAYIDTYWLVIKIALVGTAVGLTIANLVSSSNTIDVIQFFLTLVVQIWQASLSIVGMITLIFAAIHYYSPQDSMVKDEQWSVDTLKIAPEHNQTIKLFDLIAETFFICLGLVVINQIFPVSTSNVDVIPTLDLSYFSSYVLWINLLLGSSLILNMYLLIKGQWQTATRVLSILLDILGIAFVALLANIALNPEAWNLSGISETIKGDSNTIIHWIQNTIYISFAVFVIIVAFEIFGHLKVLLKRKQTH